MNNFFTTISPYLKALDLNMNIAQGGTEGTIVVSILPKAKVDDPEAKKIAPIVLKGTPQELDAQLLQIIQQPIQSFSGLTSNIKEFEEAEAKLKEQNAMTKAAADKKKKESEANGKTFDKHNKKFNEFIEKKDYDNADKYLTLCKGLDPLPAKQKKDIAKMEKSLEEIKPADQTDLFAGNQATVVAPAKEEKPQGPAQVIQSNSSFFNEEQIEAIEQEQYDKQNRGNESQPGFFSM